MRVVRFYFSLLHFWLFILVCLKWVFRTLKRHAKLAYMLSFDVRPQKWSNFWGQHTNTSRCNQRGMWSINLQEFLFEIDMSQLAIYMEWLHAEISNEIKRHLRSVYHIHLPMCSKHIVVSYFIKPSHVSSCFYLWEIKFKKKKTARDKALFVHCHSRWEPSILTAWKQLLVRKTALCPFH